MIFQSDSVDVLISLFICKESEDTDHQTVFRKVAVKGERKSGKGKKFPTMILPHLHCCKKCRARGNLKMY